MCWRWMLKTNLDSLPISKSSVPATGLSSWNYWHSRMWSRGCTDPEKALLGMFKVQCCNSGFALYFKQLRNWVSQNTGFSATKFEQLRVIYNFSNGLLGCKTLPCWVKPDQDAEGIFPCYQKGFVYQPHFPGTTEQVRRLLPLSSCTGCILHG